MSRLNGCAGQVRLGFSGFLPFLLHFCPLVCPLSSSLLCVCVVHPGFGHLCIFVNDLAEACARFTSLGVPFKKRPEEGSMRHIAFILDPDAYWVEVIAKGGRKIE